MARQRDMINEVRSGVGIGVDWRCVDWGGKVRDVGVESCVYGLLADFASLEECYGQSEHGNCEEGNVCGGQSEVCEAEVVFLCERIAHEQYLDVWCDNVDDVSEAFDECICAGFHLACDIFAGSTEEEHCEAYEESHKLCQSGRTRNGDGAQCPESLGDECYGHDELCQSEVVFAELCSDGLKGPVFVYHEDEDVGDCQCDGDSGCEGRREYPVVEIVAPERDDNCDDERADAEAYDRHIESRGGGFHYLMSDCEQENECPYPCSESNCADDAEELADDEYGSVDWFADNGEYGFVVDFFCHDTGCDECAENDAEEKNRTESDVDHNFIIVVEGVAAECWVEYEYTCGYEQNNDEDGLSNRFDECVTRNGPDLCEQCIWSCVGFVGYKCTTRQGTVWVGSIQ